MKALYDFFSLIYPVNCPACGKAIAKGETLLCTICRYELPETGYHKVSQNPVVRKFYGRIKFEFAFSYLHFHKSGIVQVILHQFKYRNQPEIGEKLGEWFALDLLDSFSPVPWDVIIPIPLHRSKEKKRGYNQSNYFAAGLSGILDIPWSGKAVIRTTKSETQTHKSKMERWKNVKDIFQASDALLINDKHILLVDDVITTGATLESCGQMLLDAGAAKVSVATLATAR